MKRSLFSYMFVALLLTLTATTLSAKSKELVLEIQRIKNTQGQLHYQLFACPSDAETPWNELKPSITAQATIQSDTLRLSLPAMPSGKYIARVFQDTNVNELLDFSGNGIPKEPTGFSNNPSLLLGYPKPIDSCFLYDKAESTSHLQVIKLNNKSKRKRIKNR